MKIALVFLTLMSLALSFEARAASENCARAESALAKAREFSVNKRYLLAAIYFTEAGSLACESMERGEARLGFAQTLVSLGEAPSALAELKEIAANPNFPEKIRGRAELEAALHFDLLLPNASAPTQNAFQIWQGRNEDLREKLLASTYSPAQKLSLRDLQPIPRREKNPWIAGTASALVPGLGQIYTGEYQTAAVSLVLNGLFLLSTIELAHKKLGFTAAISGVAFSTVYLGNIISAVKGASAVNEKAKLSREEELRARLLEISAP